MSVCFSSRPSRRRTTNIHAVFVMPLLLLMMMRQTHHHRGIQRHLFVSSCRGGQTTTAATTTAHRSSAGARRGIAHAAAWISIPPSATTATGWRQRVGRNNPFYYGAWNSASSSRSSSSITTSATFGRYFSSRAGRRLVRRNTPPLAASKQPYNDASNNKYRPNKKKLIIKKNAIDAENKLAAAFDELARKEGFDDSLAFYADDATFEDDTAAHDGDEDDDELQRDPSRFRINDFDDNSNNNNNNIPSWKMSKEEYEMEQRLQAARRDMATGRVSVPQELDDYVNENFDLSLLGYRQEEDPWGSDETHRRPTIHVVMDAKACPACGADFQCHDAHRPGYLPPDKFAYQVKLGKIQELQRLQRKAEQDDQEWTPEDEVEFLIQTAASSTTNKDNQQQKQSVADIDVTAMAEEMGIDLTQDPNKDRVICKRCHGLQNFGRVEDALRPGWTDEPLLSQEKFRNLLRPIREKPAVIIALVDLFDFAGSVLPELDSIAGDNPVILAANKADLMPDKMGKLRVENWVRRELEYMGIKSLANVGGAVQLVSCKTGMGVTGMLEKARQLAAEMDCDIYVIGAANAGKSTLLNYILWKTVEDQEKDKLLKTTKVRAGNKNKLKGAVTTSPLPGTTLKFIKVDLGGRSLYDTPGLLVPGTLTQLLTPDELKIVVPTKQVEPLSFLVKPGKAVLVGGLARLEVLEPSRPFFFTFFVANEIKLHPTSSERIDAMLQEHVGTMLTPPLAPERMQQWGDFESHVVEVEGNGWQEAAADITLTGLGWVAVTGAGTAKIRISVPKGIGVTLRPPLMPFDLQDSTARYTGGRAVRRTTKTKHGKGRHGVGRN